MYFGRRGSIVAEVGVEGFPLGKHIKRKYVKFQDVLTQVGGLVKAFMLIGSILANIFSVIQFFNDYLFNISLKDNEIQAKLPSPKRVKKQNFIEENSKNTIKKIKQDDSKTNKTLASNSKQVNFTKNPIVLTPTKQKSTNNEMRKVADKSTAVSNISLKTCNFTHFSIERSNKIYPKTQALKHFMIQFFCTFSNKPIVLRKKFLEKKISHSLSIETILDKMFIIEVMRNITLSDNQNILANRLYYDIMGDRTVVVSADFNSDSVEDIFGLSKEKLEEYFKN